MIFLQHLFISCRTGAFRHLNFIESVYNLQAGDHLVRKVRTRRGELKRTHAPSQTKKSRCLLGRVRRGWSGATSERPLIPRVRPRERRGVEGVEGKKIIKPTAFFSPTPRCLPPLNHHQIEAGDWGERAEEPDRRREREKRSPGDWWRRPIHHFSPTTTPTCCTSSSSTSRNGAVDPLQLGFADHLRPCCSPSPTTSTAQETTLNLSSLTVVFWIFALIILQLVI